MKLLSTIAAICLSAAIATAAEVGAPIQARQAENCVATLFTGLNFTGDSTTISGRKCVSTDHLSATRTDFNGLVPL
jgi:hypothetical protein